MQKVRGEWRVGIFAIRDIAEGEEITFDYQFERMYAALSFRVECIHILILVDLCAGWHLPFSAIHAVCVMLSVGARSRNAIAERPTAAIGLGLSPSPSSQAAPPV